MPDYMTHADKRPGDVMWHSMHLYYATRGNDFRFLAQGVLPSIESPIANGLYRYRAIVRRPLV